VCDWFQRLAPDTLAELGRHYVDDVRFKDPFHDVTGVDAVHAIFSHAFERLPDARFRITGRFPGVRDSAMALWEMDCTLGGRTVCVRGATHFLFAPDGRVLLHRDYWDAAEELYGHLPVIGRLMRWLSRRVAAPSTDAAH